MTVIPSSQHQSKFFFQLFLLIALLLSFVVQIKLVFPLEQRFVPAEIVELVSLLFLPFGLKVIFATLAGTIAIIPIFLAHAFVDIYFGKGASEILLEASVGVFIIYLPIAIFNFVAQRPLLKSLDLESPNTNIFRYVLALALLASMLNALIHTVIFQGFNIDLLAFRFVVGDVGGTIVVLIVLIALKRPLVRLMHSVAN